MLKIVAGSSNVFMMSLSPAKRMTKDKLMKRLVMLKMHGIIMVHGRLSQNTMRTLV